VYGNIVRVSCGGGDCHLEGPQGGLDMRTEDLAYANLRARLVPGKPDESLLMKRLSPDACTPRPGDGCRTMPLGRAPLDPRERDVIRRWIEAGATRD
jgi:hypothetical protein